MVKMSVHTNDRLLLKLQIGKIKKSAIFVQDLLALFCSCNCSLPHCIGGGEGGRRGEGRRTPGLS